MRWRRWQLGLVVVILGAALTGCWDQHPVEFRGAVAAIGIDPSGVRGQYRYTFLFPNVTVTTTSIESLAPNDQFFTITADAPTLEKAIDAIQRRQSRVLYLGQIRILCVSSHLPFAVWRDTLQEAADSGRFVLTFWLLTAPNAQQVVGLTPPSDVVPDVALYRALNSRAQPVLWPGRAWRIWAQMVTKGISPAVVEVHPTANEVVLHQLAVLSSRPVMWSPTASEGWAFIVGRVERGTMALRVGDQMVTVGLIRGHTGLRVVPTARGAIVRANLRYSGNLIGGSLRPEDSPAEDRRVEQLVAARIQQRVLEAWRAAIVTRTDPMGFHRLGQWSDTRLSPSVSDWSGWTLHLQVRFTLRDEGVLR